MNWLSIFKPLVDAFNGWRSRKHELRIKKHELKVTRIVSEANIAEARAKAAVDRLGQRQEADINWEVLSIQNSGWKDEYLTILISTSLILVFIPWTQPFVLEGFRALEETPTWYQVIILIVVGSAFGVRAFTNFQSLVAPRKAKKETS